MLRIARIDLATGLVVNVEMAGQEWLDAHAADPDYLFVVDDPAQPAAVGEKYVPAP